MSFSIWLFIDELYRPSLSINCYLIFNNYKIIDSYTKQYIKYYYNNYSCYSFIIDEFSNFEIIKISVFVRFVLNNDTFIEVKLSLSNFLKLTTSDNLTQLLIKLIEYNQFDIWKCLYFTTDSSFVIIGNISWVNIQLNQIIETKKNKHQEIKYHKIKSDMFSS